MNGRGLVDVDRDKVVISGTSTGRKSWISLGRLFSKAKNGINISFPLLLRKSFPKRAVALDGTDIVGR